MPRTHRRPSIAAGAVLTAVMILAALTNAGTAHAWGERSAQRACGRNWIESWAIPGGGQANTIKTSGSCSGELWVGLRASNGYVVLKKGDNRSASIKKDGVWVGGTHRGCYSCAASLT